MLTDFYGIWKPKFCALIFYSYLCSVFKIKYAIKQQDKDNGISIKV